MTRDEFYRRLDRTLNAPAALDAFQESAWAEAGVECAVFVADLTGFTRITREKGIVHFLAAFRRAVAIGEPALRRAGARFIKTAADNILATLPGVGAAVDAARDMIKIPIGEGVEFCIGIGFGRILALEDDLFGDAVNVAYKLGEDVAKGGEVLLSSEAAAQFKGSLEGPLRKDLGGMTLEYFRLKR